MMQQFLIFNCVVTDEDDDEDAESSLANQQPATSNQQLATRSRAPHLGHVAVSDLPSQFQLLILKTELSPL
jgi:hypothetical protein